MILKPGFRIKAQMSPFWTQKSKAINNEDDENLEEEYPRRKRKASPEVLKQELK